MRLPASLVAVVALGACTTGPPLVLPAVRSARATDGAAGLDGAGARPARAFVIDRQADLLKGPKATGKLGDFRIDNDRVAFVVDALGRPAGFAQSGGNLVDAAPRGGEDALGELFGCLADAFPRQPIYERLEPGRRGGTAYVRAIGHDSGDPSLGIVTEYALGPASPALEITTTVTNRGSSSILGYAVGDAVEWGRTERLVPGIGLGPIFGRQSSGAGWVGAIGDEVAYAYVVAKDRPGAVTGSFGAAWSDLDAGTVDLPAGASAQVTRWLVVARPAGSMLAEGIAQVRGERWARVEGRIVQEDTGAPVPGARVILDDGTGHPVAVTRSTRAGYVLLMPPGDYRVRAEAPGRRGPEHLHVSARAGSPTTLDLLMSRPSELSFTVTAGGTPTPAKLTFIGIGGTPTPALGPDYAIPGGNATLTVDGRGKLPLPPGHYRVVVSRGPAYTLDDRPLELAPGQSAHLDFKIRRAVDTHGWRCFDPHQHTIDSPDSAVTLADRAASDLAEGLDPIVATDHNVVTDYGQTLARLRAAGPLEAVAGDEATGEGVGHFGAYPMMPRPDEPRAGAPDVHGLAAAQIFAALRASDSGADKVIQVNHPRAGMAGYFDMIHYQPGAPELPAGFSGDFDALEVFSGKDVSRTEAPIRDWMSLLSRGLIYTAVGGSDAHLIYGEEVGYPRTCIEVSDADAARSPAAMLIDGIKRRRAVLVTNGPFVRVSVAGRSIGQRAPAPHGRARLDLQIMAAPWVDVRRFEVWINGSRRGKPVEIPASRSVLRYRGSINLRVERDAYVVVVVRGDASLEPVVSRLSGQPAPTPLAVTNPIFLDRDGDGRIELGTPPAPAAAHRR